MAAKLQKVEQILNRMGGADLVTLYNNTFALDGYPQIFDIGDPFDDLFNNIFSGERPYDLIALTLQSNISLGEWESANYCTCEDLFKLFNDGREAVESQVSLREMAEYIVEKDNPYLYAEIGLEFVDEDEE